MPTDRPLFGIFSPVEQFFFLGLNSSFFLQGGQKFLHLAFTLQVFVNGNLISSQRKHVSLGLLIWSRCRFGGRRSPSIFCRDRAPDFVWSHQAKRMHQIVYIDFKNYIFFSTSERAHPHRCESSERNIKWFSQHLFMA